MKLRLRWNVQPKSPASYMPGGRCRSPRGAIRRRAVLLIIQCFHLPTLNSNCTAAFLPFSPLFPFCFSFTFPSFIFLYFSSLLSPVSFLLFHFLSFPFLRFTSLYYFSVCFLSNYFSFFPFSFLLPFVVFSSPLLSVPFSVYFIPFPSLYYAFSPTLPSSILFLSPFIHLNLSFFLPFSALPLSLFF